MFGFFDSLRLVSDIQRSKNFRKVFCNISLKNLKTVTATNPWEKNLSVFVNQDNFIGQSRPYNNFMEIKFPK